MKSFVKVHGNEWKFKSDVDHDPYKTGWVYEITEKIKKIEKQGLNNKAIMLIIIFYLFIIDKNHCQYNNNTNNFISFKCHQPHHGRVKIGYLGSYGKSYIK